LGACKEGGGAIQKPNKLLKTKNVARKKGGKGGIHNWCWEPIGGPRHLGPPCLQRTRYLLEGWGRHAGKKATNLNIPSGKFKP